MQPKEIELFDNDVPGSTALALSYGYISYILLVKTRRPATFKGRELEQKK